MKITVDLHAHSVFAGGTQALKQSSEFIKENRKKALKHLEVTNHMMPLKGIDIIGTGDCQYLPWTKILKDILIEEKNGIFIIPDKNNTKFILQSEVIFTAPIGNRSKIVHVLLLFPSFNSVDRFRDYLDSWNVKHEKMARPFIKCQSVNEVSTKINSILDIDDLIEVIPAHIMTPQGIYGSDIRINMLKDFFGDVASRITIFETGLSADPEFLSLIPELDNRVLISCSDAHSGALHRMGREFTIINLPNVTYPNIITSLRNNKIELTAEFPPEEGRFFLTGHRSGRKSPGKHGSKEYCYFSPQHVPPNDICPICNKTLTIGVYQRCCEISKAQNANRNLGEFQIHNKFIRMVPLIDILSDIYKIKTKTAKRLISLYQKIIGIVGPESTLWQQPISTLKDKLEDQIDEKLINAIIQVKNGNFTFHPYGYDGTYGSLKIGQKGNYQDIKVIQSNTPIQTHL